MKYFAITVNIKGMTSAIIFKILGMYYIDL